MAYSSMYVWASIRLWTYPYRMYICEGQRLRTALSSMYSWEGNCLWTAPYRMYIHEGQRLRTTLDCSLQNVHLRRTAPQDCSFKYAFLGKYSSLDSSLQNACHRITPLRSYALTDTHFSTHSSRTYIYPGTSTNSLPTNPSNRLC